MPRTADSLPPRKGAADVARNDGEQPLFTVVVETEVGSVWPTKDRVDGMSPYEAAFLLIARNDLDGTYRFPEVDWDCQPTGSTIIVTRHIDRPDLTLRRDKPGIVDGLR